MKRKCVARLPRDATAYLAFYMKILSFHLKRDTLLRSVPQPLVGTAAPRKFR